MASNHDRISAIAGIAAATIGFGTIPIFLRSLTDDLDYWTVNGVRYCVAMLFWLPFVIVMGRNLRRVDPAAFARLWRVALIPVSVNVCAQVLWAICPYYLEATMIGFTVRVTFLFTIGFEFLLVVDERRLARSPLFYAGAATSVGGVVVMFWAKAAAAGDVSVIGVSVVVAAAACFGLYGVLVKRWMSDYPARLSFGVVCIYTAPTLLVLMLIKGDYEQLAEIGPQPWALMGASAMIGIAFGHVLIYRSIRRIGPIVSSGVLMATPFVTYSGGMLFLGERMTLAQFLGGLLVVAGGGVLVIAQARIEKRNA